MHSAASDIIQFIDLNLISILFLPAHSRHPEERSDEGSACLDVPSSRRSEVGGRRSAVSE